MTDGGREAGRQEQVRPLLLDHGAEHLVHDGLDLLLFLLFHDFSWAASPGDW